MLFSRQSIHPQDVAQGYRQQHSVAVLGDIQKLLLAHLHAVVPGSALGKALHYMSAQRPKLSRYVEDGSYPIDNNPAENSIRPFSSVPTFEF
jgi:hypothetical protein